MLLQIYIISEALSSEKWGQSQLFYSGFFSFCLHAFTDVCKLFFISVLRVNAPGFFMFSPAFTPSQ